MIKQTLPYLLSFFMLSQIGCKKVDSVSLQQSKLKNLQIGEIQASTPSNTVITIPLYGNATISKPAGANEVLTSSNGLANWTNAQSITSMNVTIPNAGTAKLVLNLKVAPSGKNSVIKVTFDGVSKEVAITGETFHDVYVGDFIVGSPKTIRIDFQGVSKTGGYFADLKNVKLSGTAINGHGTVYTVPLGGNAFITTNGGEINDDGLTGWTKNTTIASTFFHSNSAGNLSIKINARIRSGSSVARITLNGVSKDVSISGNTYKDTYVGDFPAVVGYNKIDIQGVSKTSFTYGEVSNYKLGSDALTNGIIYANDSTAYYWSRRGPSCHLDYQVPTEDTVEYYYNEIEVPEEGLAIASYYMAIGFNGGYFGIQYGDPSEPRRVLFSVWSPYVTDNPDEIPEDDKIILNRKGKNVIAGEFGGEGSGGQSYLEYNWKTGTTYKFLLKGKPDGNGKTDFTAWIYIPEESEWRLIASFKKPKLSSYLFDFHSFLENFSPDHGFLQRSATYKNQWVRTKSGQWLKVEKTNFTVDGTHDAQQRIDATGGTNTVGYFLKIGGFFNNGIEPYSELLYNNTNLAPTIDLSKLP